MVDVLPQAQRCKDSILICDQPITITTVNRFVVFGECKESISLGANRGCRLRSEVPK
jgi:hypothetical protein